MKGGKKMKFRVAKILGSVAVCILTLSAVVPGIM